MAARYDRAVLAKPVAPGAPPPTPDQAEALVVSALSPEWVRRFDLHTDTDGSTIYVDTETGQTYDEIPALHSTDGHDT